MSQRGTIQFIILLLLIVGVVVGLILIKKPQIFRPKASLTGTRIEAVGPNVVNGRTTSQSISLKLTYVPPSTTGLETLLFNLSAGTNFIGMGVTTDTTPAQLLEKTQGKCDSIFSFNTQTNQAESYFSDPTKAAYFNNLTRLVGGKGYLIKCSAAVTIQVSGTPVLNLPQLVVGNVQYIAIPKFYQATAEEFLRSVSRDGLDCIKISRYVAGNKETYSKGGGSNNFTIDEATGGFELSCQAAANLTTTPAVGTGTTAATVGVGSSVKGIATTVLAEGSIFPTHFRISNDRSTLDSSPEQVFDQNDKEIDWTLTSGNGEKIIYAQFKVNGTWSQVYQTTVILDLSTPTTSGESVDYNLNTGGNAIGIPVQVSITPAQLLEKTSGKCDSIFSFNTQTNQAESYFSDPTKAAFFNNLAQITPGKGYQVKCSSSTSFTLSGAPVTTMPTLVISNVQYISLPKGKTITAEEFLTTSSNSLLNCTQVDRYENGAWVPHIKGSAANNFQMNDREGYTVKCLAASSPPAPVITSCGRLRDKVQQAFGKSCREVGYDKVADLAPDGVINNQDNSILTVHFTDQSWCEGKLGATYDPCALASQIDEHFGVAGGAYLGADQLHAVGASWGATWNVGQVPNTSDYHFVPMFRLGRSRWAADQGWDPGRCTISSCPQITDLVRQVLSAGVKNNYYQLGNEPNLGLDGEGEVSMASYVTQYEILVREIKAQDPGAHIIGPAVIFWLQNFAGHNNQGKWWLQEFVNSYKASHQGQIPPMDILNLHLYDNTNWHRDDQGRPTYAGTGTQLLINELEDFRRWADSIPEYKDKPIWITEFGLTHCNNSWGDYMKCLPVNDPQMTADITQFLTTLINYFHSNQNRLKLEKWFIFFGRNETGNGCRSRGCDLYPIFLYDENNNITGYGRLYKQLSTQFAQNRGGS